MQALELRKDERAMEAEKKAVETTPLAAPMMADLERKQKAESDATVAALSAGKLSSTKESVALDLKDADVHNVLRLLAEGKANKEIARTLSISEHTIKSHVHSLLAKLGMQSRTQAALYAARIGLVSSEQVGRGPA